MMTSDEYNWLEEHMHIYRSDCCNAIPTGEVMVLDMDEYAIGICSKCNAHTGFTLQVLDEQAEN